MPFVQGGRHSVAFGPFRRWIRRMVLEHGSAEVARRIGVDEAIVRRWCNGSYREHGRLVTMQWISVGTVEQATASLDGETLWTLYPDYDPGEGQPWRNGGKPVGKYRRMTDDEVRAAHRLHLEAKLSIRELGRRLYERYGYANARSCANALVDAFRVLGLTSRDRIEATVIASTVHGLAPRSGADPEHRKKVRRASGEILDRPRCIGLRQSPPRQGQRCSNRALADSEFCWAHDPRREDERQAILRDARSRL